MHSDWGGLQTLCADALRHAEHLDAVAVLPLAAPAGAGWRETSLLTVGGEPAAVAAAAAMALLADATKIANKAAQLVGSGEGVTDPSLGTASWCETRS